MSTLKQIAYAVAIVLCGVVLWGCKRNTVMPELERPLRGESKEDLLKDSVYFYTYHFYLWQSELPDRLSDIRGYTLPYNSADDVLDTLKGYARNAQGAAYDRFSFLDRWGTINAEIQQGLAGSFGFDVRYNNDTDLFVKKVDAGSPAHHAGVRRGWQILAVNGNSNLSYDMMDQDNFNFLFGALDAGHISLKLRNPDGEEVALALDRANYQLQPIVSRRVYTVGGKKVGYFAFDTFVSTIDNRGNATYVQRQLDQLFANFEDEGVRELIVDLRYNGGGAVATAEYLSNMLIPASVGSKLMYTSKINAGLEAFLQTKGESINFSPVYFEKTNRLDLNRIYFLVTETGTASASELLINNLQPHVDVKLIGEHATYGKPVGFFGWNILGADLYAVSFQTFNSTGRGDYFEGMQVDKLAYDDLTYDFGDANEEMIAEALFYARNGSFSATSDRLQRGFQGSRTERSRGRLNRKLDRRGGKGMFDFSRKIPVF